MSAQEEEVALVVKRDDLSALELGHRREERLEHSADSVPESGDEVVQDKLGIVICWLGMTLRKT